MPDEACRLNCSSPVAVNVPLEAVMFPLKVIEPAVTPLSTHSLRSLQIIGRSKSARKNLQPARVSVSQRRTKSLPGESLPIEN